MNRSMAILILSVCLAAAGQVMLKIGMSRVGALSLTGTQEAIAGVGRAFLEPRVLIGLGCYGLSAILYMVALSHIDLSVAYPVAGLSYLIITLIAWGFLGEHVPPLRWIGVLVILAGVLLVGQS